jgi:glycosyltransferase involved in cell wall biosynthesis
VVVLPYRSATQSGIAHLAFSFGRPVVATMVGGLSEVVEHERTGLLVPPEDPHALAAAIERLISDAELRARLGEQAAHLSETRYGWNRVARIVLDHYHYSEESGLDHVQVG